MGAASIQLTREELYEKVWSTPVSKLAREFGLSDVGLAKVCKRLNIPRPGLGYWAKVQAGRKGKRPPLPPIKDQTKATVVLSKTPRPTALPEPDDEVGQLIAKESLPENRITVAETLHGSHPLVQRTHLALREKPMGHDPILGAYHDGCLEVHISQSLVHRALCILDALVKGLEKRGFKVQGRNQESSVTSVEVLGEKVQFVLKEKVDRKDHELTPEEVQRKKKKPFWEPYTRYDYLPSGRLVLKISNWSYSADGLRTSWTDGEHQKIEDCLNAFVVGLIRASAKLRAERLAHEKRQREWREAEELRWREEQRRREEAERLKNLMAQANSWFQSEKIRAYLREVEKKAEERGLSLEPGGKLGRWLTWANDQADRLDPLNLEGSLLQPQSLEIE